MDGLAPTFARALTLSSPPALVSATWQATGGSTGLLILTYDTPITYATVPAAAAVVDFGGGNVQTSTGGSTIDGLGRVGVGTTGSLLISDPASLNFNGTTANVGNLGGRTASVAGFTCDVL